MDLIFNNVSLETINQNDGQVWVTSKSLAIALGYKSANAVTDLYNANADEFIKPYQKSQERR
jgi:prophage antirepressor-like protein